MTTPDPQAALTAQREQWVEKQQRLHPALGHTIWNIVRAAMSYADQTNPLTAKLEEYVHQSLLFDEQDKVKRLEGLVRALPNYEVVELHYQIVRCYRGTDDPTNFTFDSAKDAIAFYNLCCERQRME